MTNSIRGVVAVFYTVQQKGATAHSPDVLIGRLPGTMQSIHTSLQGGTNINQAAGAEPPGPRVSFRFFSERPFPFPSHSTISL